MISSEGPAYLIHVFGNILAVQEAAYRTHRLNAQVGGRFAGSYLIGCVDGPVDRFKQRELLTGDTTRESGLGRLDSMRVESDNVEAGDDLIGERSERNAVD